MSRISLWNNGAKDADYRFIDRNIGEFMDASGTGVFVHLYMGTYGQDGMPDKDVTEIQDVVFGENRDRKYSQTVYELRGTYNVQDNDFDLRQFGLFLTGDTIFIEFHHNGMLEHLGRKIIPGDVLELPHQRDDALLDEGKAINKFYVVEDASRATSGYSSTWLSHIWRVKVVPMTNSQEYGDILDKANKDPFGLDTGGTLKDMLGPVLSDLDINADLLDLAQIDVFARNFDTRQFYLVPPEDSSNPNSWIFSGDGTPPNGGYLLDAGNEYPDEAPLDSYFLRTDYSPHALFKKTQQGWRMQELDYRRGRWSAAHRILEDFINETGTVTMEDGTVMAAKQALSKLIKPKPDF